MKKTRNAKLLLGFLLTATFLACNDSGTEVSGPRLSYMLSWDAPKTTVNDENINPASDLSHYELYVSSTENFSENDIPMAYMSAVEDNDSKKLVTEFDLALLNPNDLPSGRLYVSLRVVGIDGQKSDFMTPVAWTRTNARAM